MRSGPGDPGAAVRSGGGTRLSWTGCRFVEELYVRVGGRILCVVGTGAAGMLVWSLDFKSNGGSLRVRGGFDSHLPPPVTACHERSTVGRSRRRAEAVAPVLPYWTSGPASGPHHRPHCEDRRRFPQWHPRQLPPEQGVRAGSAIGRGRDPLRGTCGPERAGAHHRYLSRPRHVQDTGRQRYLRCVQAAGAHLPQPEGAFVSRGGVGSLPRSGRRAVAGLPRR